MNNCREVLEKVRLQSSGIYFLTTLKLILTLSNCLTFHQWNAGDLPTHFISEILETLPHRAGKNGYVCCCSWRSGNSSQRDRLNNEHRSERYKSRKGESEVTVLAGDIISSSKTQRIYLKDIEKISKIIIL